MATALTQSKAACLTRSTNKISQRVVVRPVAVTSSTSRARDVQVCAKGKGRRMQAPMAPSGEMVRPQAPEVDPDNEEFCVFTRARTGPYQNWIFVSVIKGGSAANAMVKATQQTNWGQQLYTGILVRNIGAAVYKDRDAIVKGLKDQVKRTLQSSGMAPQAKIMEPLINQPVTSFEFGFKIRDKSRPKEFAKAEDLTIVPPEPEVMQQPLEKLQKFFSPESLGAMFGGSS